MESRQLSLWDNVDYERGIFAMGLLHFDEAEDSFEQARQHPFGDPVAITENMKMIWYWKERVSQLKENPSGYFEEFIEDFTAFTFPSWNLPFKKSLLHFLSDKIEEDTTLSENVLTTVFDELLKMKSFNKAADWALKMVESGRQEVVLIYQLAQAQWLSKKQNLSNQNLMQILLKRPDEVLEERIENPEIKSLLATHGAYMTPVYGVLYGIAQNLSPAEVSPINEEHQHALDSLECLLQCIHAPRSMEFKDLLKLRKKLMQTDRDLFQAYFQKTDRKS